MFADGLAILVSSCDKHRDLWSPFFTFLFRYWPDCPFHIHLISNLVEYRDARVKTIRVGKDSNWSSVFALALQQIPQSFVLVLMEDYFLDQTVDTPRITELAGYMKSKNAVCLRLLHHQVQTSYVKTILKLEN